MMNVGPLYVMCTRILVSISLLNAMTAHDLSIACVCVCVCVCVCELFDCLCVCLCVWERGEGEGGQLLVFACVCFCTCMVCCTNTCAFACERDLLIAYACLCTHVHAQTRRPLLGPLHVTPCIDYTQQILVRLAYDRFMIRIGV